MKYSVRSSKLACQSWTRARDAITSKNGRLCSIKEYKRDLTKSSNWSGFMKSIAKDNAAYDKISVDVDVMEKECC